MTTQGLVALSIVWGLGCAAQPDSPIPAAPGDKRIQLNCEAWGPAKDDAFSLDCTEDCGNHNKASVAYEECVYGLWWWQTAEEECDPALDRAARRLEACTESEWPPSLDVDPAIDPNNILVCGQFNGRYDCTEQCKNRNDAWTELQECFDNTGESLKNFYACSARVMQYRGSGVSTGFAQLLEACVNGY